MQSPDHWQEFRDLHKRMTERWDQASQLERGVLSWEAAEARRRAIEFEHTRSRITVSATLKQVAP